MITCVGSLTTARLRMVSNEIVEKTGPFEIVSLVEFGHLMVDTGTSLYQMKDGNLLGDTYVLAQLCTQPLKLSSLILEFINQSTT